MSAPQAPSPHPLVRKLESITQISAEERAALEGLQIQTAEFKADQDIVREGDQPSRCFLLLEGFTAAFKSVGDGRRQVSAIQVVGDIPDLQSLHLKTLDSGVVALTPLRIGFMRHADIRELITQFPSLGGAFWRTTLIDASILREWVANIGQRDALSRMAHLLCEIFMRLKAVGLAKDRSCPFPITQGRLAEATGMSAVHANRILMALREQEFIEHARGRLTVPDWDRLATAGDFDPTYLHLQ